MHGSEVTLSTASPADNVVRSLGGLSALLRMTIRGASSGSRKPWSFDKTLLGLTHSLLPPPGELCSYQGKQVPRTFGKKKLGSKDRSY